MTTILEKIEAAKTLEETETLRMEVVRAYSQEVTIAWQNKFWSFKKCPHCGHIKEA